MAEKDDKPLDVNLELPAFGLRRKRKDKKADDASEETAATSKEEVAPARPAEPVAPASPQPAPAAEAGSSRFAPPPTPAPTPAPAPAKHAAPEAVAQPKTPPPATPARHAAPDAPAAEAPTAAPAAPPLPPVVPPVVPPVAPPVTPPADHPAPATPGPPAAQLAPKLSDEPADDTPDEPKPARFQAAKLPRIPVPQVGARNAAAFTGILIGLLACGATWLGLQGCEAIRGTSSCGGPGFLLLLVILVLLVIIGAGMLRLLRVADHAATSFLAVGLLSMLVLLFLTNWIFEWWIVLIITPLAAGTYVLSQWVTSHAGSD